MSTYVALYSGFFGDLIDQVDKQIAAIEGGADERPADLKAADAVDALITKCVRYTGDYPDGESAAYATSLLESGYDEVEAAIRDVQDATVLRVISGRIAIRKKLHCSEQLPEEDDGAPTC